MTDIIIAQPEAAANEDDSINILAWLRPAYLRDEANRREKERDYLLDTAQHVLGLPRPYLQRRLAWVDNGSWIVSTDGYCWRMTHPKLPDHSGLQLWIGSLAVLKDHAPYQEKAWHADNWSWEQAHTQAEAYSLVLKYYGPDAA